ncbi:ABC transporter substrate-binding protein [Lysinibacillus sp. 54212]|uniref:ABC transporter substrate-binding protein n=1 Tax=Lysinibacillus sp. 54212 TaxID=3119829 RepID=UPI002FC839FE
MKKIYLVALLSLLIAVLAACSGGDKNSTDNNDSSNATSSEPKKGGSLTVAVTGDPNVLNPLYTGDRVSLTIQQALFAPLFYTDGGEVEPALAESLTPSEDNLTYTLKLKEGLTWHDGETLNADDIVFTMSSLLDEGQNSSIRGSFVYDGKPVQVTKVDETTVEFKLPVIAPAFESALQSLFPIPEHVFAGEADLQKSTKNSAPIGSGPFKFVEYKPSQYMKLERFDGYFAGAAYLDNVVFQIVKDENAAGLALQNGEINLKAIQPTEVEQVKSTSNVELVTYPEYRLVYMALNHNIEALQNKKFRQALALTLDRNDMIQAAFGSDEYAEPAYSIFTKDVEYLAADLEQNAQDVKKAKQLLEESGIDPSKLKLNMYFASNNKALEGIALYTQQQFKEIGVDLVLDAGDSSTIFTAAEDREGTDYAFLLNGYIMGSEADSYKLLFMSNAAYNYANYKNATLDPLWEKGAVTPNGPERGAIYAEIQEALAEDVAVYPISYNYNVIALDKRYGGLEEAKPIPVTMVRDLSKIYLK